MRNSQRLSNRDFYGPIPEYWNETTRLQYQQFLETYEARTAPIAFRKKVDPHELGSNVILAVLTGLEDYDQTRTSFFKWTNGVAEICANNLVRRHASHRTTELVEEPVARDTSPSRRQLRRELRRFAVKCIEDSELAIKTKVIGASVVLGGLNTSEAAEAFGEDKASVSVYVNRFRAVLHSAFEDSPYNSNAKFGRLRRGCESAKSKLVSAEKSRRNRPPP